MSKKKGGMTDFDRQMMGRAIKLAYRGQGRVEPNPMVGCVIVKKGLVIGEGYHKRYGGPHAEVVALQACQETPRGATVYVSLEPCNHQGQTPPCAPALIEAKIATLFTALRDPNPAVTGRGLARLRRAGIQIHAGVCKEEAATLLAPYLTLSLLHRPFVMAKWAQSLDGKLATRSGHSKWISCLASRRRVHQLRARVDAIMIGSGTLITDDPDLTAREVPLRRKALRVLLDRRLRIPSQGRIMLSCRQTPTLLFTSRAACRSTKARLLEKRGLQILPCRLSGNRLDLKDLLKQLSKRQVTNLLVEGGPTLLNALLRQQLVDEAHVFVAPMLMGDAQAPAAYTDRLTKTIPNALHPRVQKIERLGDDIYYQLRLTPTPT